MLPRAQASAAAPAGDAPPDLEDDTAAHAASVVPQVMATADESAADAEEERADGEAPQNDEASKRRRMKASHGSSTRRPQALLLQGPRPMPPRPLQPWTSSGNRRSRPSPFGNRARSSYTIPNSAELNAGWPQAPQKGSSRSGCGSACGSQERRPPRCHCTVGARRSTPVKRNSARPRNACSQRPGGRWADVWPSARWWSYVGCPGRNVGRLWLGTSSCGGGVSSGC